MTATCVKDVSAAAFITAYAAHLKRSGKLEIPVWVDLVKTSCAKELPPQDPDWFYTRAAALARQVYMSREPLGLAHLRKHFGGQQRHGRRPNHARKAAGGCIRKPLQALEKLGIVKVGPNGGRVITPAGRRELDLISAQA
ncbi:hypothetical protein IWQ60_003022 [Tieghemiomyces parasiticus]|uniref:40S ribosomal protein S19 n=1 Tax=Tieghemiomyces parasiticus TaxID=78921 RepID=A0A9W8AE15_9FUNG|nr:hypothetical protein IWQ60_003022 [Tieghemiomyces parasiticus]